MTARRAPPESDDALEHALALHRAGRLQESKAAYKRLLRKDPGNHAALNALGILYGQLGDLQQAEKTFRMALSISPRSAAYHANLGVVLKRAGKLPEAVESYERALAGDADNATTLCNLGSALLTLGRTDAAVPYLRKAVAIDPEHADAHANLAIALHSMGTLEDACAHALEAVRLAPLDAGVHGNLGLILCAQGRIDEAQDVLRKALALDPQDPVVHNNLGLVHLARGAANEAVACFRTAVEKRPAYADAWANLGGALAKSGRFEEALACIGQALAHAPGDARIVVGRVNALRAAGRTAEAIAEAQGVLAKDPAAFTARTALGLAFLSEYRYDEAIREFEKAIEIDPGDALAQNNLGVSYWAIGDAKEAIGCFRRAIALNPGNLEAHSNLVMNLNYTPGISRALLYSEHRAVGEVLEKEHKAGWSVHENSRNVDRKLRIGYVSGDFCEHAVSFFTEPVLARHDRTRFEVSCLSAGTRDDDVTKRFRERADHWLDLAGVSDAQAARLVREHGIDILIDLSGHTALNRLGVFARKPAPVQAHWLGYMNTTGMEALDYRITDARLDPRGESDGYYTERLVRLPLACAFQPPSGCPDVGPLPSSVTEVFTFACLNRPAKITPEVVEIWARILSAVPNSLLLLARADNSTVQTRIIGLFGRHDVHDSRLRFVSKLTLDDYLRLHSGIDLALDPFPYNGGATSCHSLWMGVPFVALRGERYMGRMGADLLEAIGLTEFVAAGPDQYVEIAVTLANRRRELAELRAGIRRRILQSSLGRVDEFVRALEDAYSGMWRAWCADPRPGFSHRAPEILPYQEPARWPAPD
jgi:protein O-GlcNAc transferase